MDESNLSDLKVPCDLRCDMKIGDKRRTLNIYNSICNQPDQKQLLNFLETLILRVRGLFVTHITVALRDLSTTSSRLPERVKDSLSILI
jgi:hypothetical protein